MAEPWSTLVPIAIVTAVLPVQVAVTMLMLRAPGGRGAAAAWVGGMTVVRLLQFLLLGGVLETAVDDGKAGTSAVEGALLLVVAVLLFVSAARKALKQPDDDAPAPAWMVVAATLSPRQAFLAGAGLVALSPKLWAFTLGAIGAIGDAELTGADGWLAFVAFVVLAQSTHLAAIVLAVVAPDRAGAVLGRVGGALEANSRPVMIGLSAVFGAWFLLKALAAFGVLPG